MDSTYLFSLFFFTYPFFKFMNLIFKPFLYLPLFLLIGTLCFGLTHLFPPLFVKALCKFLKFIIIIIAVVGVIIIYIFIYL